MAAKDEGVEKRPALTDAETRRQVGDVNPDTETTTPVGEVAEGIDDATRDLIVHDTTTRERTVNAKRAHEPLDLDAADDDQPDEAGNAPRAAEVGGSTGPTESTSGLVVSEEQVRAGAEARVPDADATPAGGSDSSGDKSGDSAASSQRGTGTAARK